MHWYFDIIFKPLNMSSGLYSVPFLFSFISLHPLAINNYAAYFMFFLFLHIQKSKCFFRKLAFMTHLDIASILFLTDQLILFAYCIMALKYISHK